PVRLSVTPQGLSLTLAETTQQHTEQAASRPIEIPTVSPITKLTVLLLDQATPTTCGAKAASAGRLLELTKKSGGLFHAPRGLALLFGMFELCLAQAPKVQRAYQDLLGQLAQASRSELDARLERLRALVLSLALPDSIVREIRAAFLPEVRLAVRS